MDAISRERRCLFLLSQQLQIVGVAVEGKVLSQAEALALWLAHAWQPACEGQPWPVQGEARVDSPLHADPVGAQPPRDRLHAVVDADHPPDW